jgi:hypothetical protein
MRQTQGGDFRAAGNPFWVEENSGTETVSVGGAVEDTTNIALGATYDTSKYVVVWGTQANRYSAAAAKSLLAWHAYISGSNVVIESVWEAAGSQDFYWTLYRLPSGLVAQQGQVTGVAANGATTDDTTLSDVGDKTKAVILQQQGGAGPCRGGSGYYYTSFTQWLTTATNLRSSFYTGGADTLGKYAYCVVHPG